MAELKKALESLGFTDVKTLLNSGNVLFFSEEKNIRLITQQIEEKLRKTCGFSVRVLVRTHKNIQSLVESNPFKDISVTPETRLFITFFSEEPKSSLKIPYESPEKDFRILQISNGAICSMLILSPKRGTVDVMSFIEREFGKNVTTRSWNTVTKLLLL